MRPLASRRASKNASTDVRARPRLRTPGILGDLGGRNAQCSDGASAPSGTAPLFKPPSPPAVVPASAIRLQGTAHKKYSLGVRPARQVRSRRWPLPILLMSILEWVY